MTVTQQLRIGVSVGKMLCGCRVFLRRKNDERGKLKLRISPLWHSRMTVLGSMRTTDGVVPVDSSVMKDRVCGERFS